MCEDNTLLWFCFLVELTSLKISQFPANILYFVTYDFLQFLFIDLVYLGVILKHNFTC